MGRRKERRLAAMGAGRRVKLDLFAEPSGDNGGPSAQQNVGGDDDSKINDELPNSPSSSGQQPQNPLLLLEQYSDEDLDEGSTDVHSQAIVEDGTLDDDDQVKKAALEGSEDINAGIDPMQEVEKDLIDKDFASQDPLQELEYGDSTANDSADVLKTNKLEEATCPVASSKQRVEDLRTDWKMVLHEESNQYYYWNVVTGETSWEIPDALASESVTTSIDKAVDADIGQDTPLDKGQDITTRKLNYDPKLNCENSDNADLAKNIDGCEEGSKSDSFDEEDKNRGAGQSDGTSLSYDFPVVNGTKLDVGQCRENKINVDLLSSQLVKRSEIMLERLSSLKSLNCYQDIKLKCMTEIEIRLADIKALSHHGSSLLPFWMHTQDQLKRLEVMVDGVVKDYASASINRLEASPQSHERNDAALETDSSGKKASFPLETHSPEYTAEQSNFEAQSGGISNTEKLSPFNSVGGDGDLNKTERESELPARPVFHSNEEIDMDVDMEVEDTSTSLSNAHYHLPPELSDIHNTMANQGSAVAGQVFGAPPPIEEWVPPPPPPDDEPIPPPPPDDESFPPPPPDEPSGDFCPPVSLSESVQPFSYSEHYPLPYQGPGLEYYGQIQPAVSGTTLYMQPEGVQVAVSHLPHYYENAYAVAPLVVDPVEPSAYYGLQDGTLNPVSLSGVSAVEQSGRPSEPEPENCEADVAKSLHSHVEAASSSLTKSNLDIRSAHGITQAIPEVPEAGQPSVEAEAKSLLVNNAASSSSDSTRSSAAPATTSKVQSKASRAKKRTATVVSTLRPNKKVSTLVDKWKAVKEELQEEEEEPEDALEILEKKRQREIEEWRAQQIASGEAKDNANFQPVVGDWRERVKRKRAQKMKEAGKSSSDVATDGTKQNQQPDLVELSRGLPSAWQAYWDDSTKQIYYGNTLTSETTWSRPKD